MEFLDKLWDETLAGPAPDSGLGKHRKYNSFSARSAAAPPMGAVARPQDDSHAIPVSRSITVLRSGAPRNLSVSVDSASGSSAPSSPSSPSTPDRNFKKLTRRKSAPGVSQNCESKGPTGYDWILLCALDR